MCTIIDLINRGIVKDIEWTPNPTTVKIVIDKTELTEDELKKMYNFDQKHVTTGNSPEQRRMVEENMRRQLANKK